MRSDKTVTFPIEVFRELYPQFPRMPNYPDTVVKALAEQAKCYFNIGSCSVKCLDQLWMLVTAHLLYLRQKTLDSANDGSNPAAGVITSATIDKVSVSFAAPPSDGSSNTHWFNLTPYGQQYLVLNKRCNSGVRSIGGSTIRHSFGRVRR